MIDKYDDKLIWIVMNQKARSLFHLIADGIFKETTVGKETWKSLFFSVCLKDNYKEGFNVQEGSAHEGYMKARIGIVAFNQKECGDNCDSCVGFGISESVTISDPEYTPETSSCGNIHDCSRLAFHTPAIGFILVQ